MAVQRGCWPPNSRMVNPWTRMVDGIASKLAFFPPQPASYTVEEHKDGTGQLYIKPVDRSYQRVTSARVHWLQTSQGNRIISAFVPYADGRGSARAKLTVLYSHGNAVDLGQMLPVYKDLSRLLRVNIMGYDYTGYGACSGIPSVTATCSDISAVLEALETIHGVKRRDVVLYGQSVGSGPTVWLAAQQQGIAGVVLHSPLLSGVRVFNPNIRYWPSWADIYPNHLLVRKINAPLLVMHGTADEVIHVSAGQKLAASAPAAVPPLIAEGFDHQNLEACPEYLPRLRQFLQQLASGALPAASGANR
eukprot:GHUV01004789.1.p1 GENE.GHUV01004789.1~~GHUV01004789.1.p1  ORF type:complete len:305 (+),score=70.05 GHUV01004789.1:413-1327(+)